MNFLEQPFNTSTRPMSVCSSPVICHHPRKHAPYSCKVQKPIATSAGSNKLQQQVHHLHVRYPKLRKWTLEAVDKRCKCELELLVSWQRQEMMQRMLGLLSSDAVQDLQQLIFVMCGQFMLWLILNPTLKSLPTQPKHCFYD